MPLYKYEHDEENGDWQMASSRFGGPDEEKLFNRFNPDPNSYYIAANTYQEAHQQLSSPDGQQMLQSYHQSALDERDANAKRDPVEVRAERFEELNQALSGYLDHKEYNIDEKHGVEKELLHMNQFGMQSRVRGMESAETAHNLYQEEEARTPNPGFNSYFEQQTAASSERYSRQEVLRYDGLTMQESLSISENQLETRSREAEAMTPAINPTRNSNDYFERSQQIAQGIEEPQREPMAVSANNNNNSISNSFNFSRNTENEWER